MRHVDEIFVRVLAYPQACWIASLGEELSKRHEELPALIKGTKLNALQRFTTIIPNMCLAILAEGPVATGDDNDTFDLAWQPIQGI